VFDLACALVDADGLHTDNELWALIATFGPRLESQLGHADPAALRRAGIVTGRRRWVEQPSPLLELVLAADRRDGTSTSWTVLRPGHGRRPRGGGHRRPRGAPRAGGPRAAAQHPAAVDRRSTGSPGRARPGRGARGAVPPRPEPPRTRAGVGDASAPPLAPAAPLEELHAELDALIGLDVVKAEVKLVADLLVVQRLADRAGPARPPPAAGTSSSPATPAPGRTTVARLLAELYRTLGVVTRGHLVETDRGGLVAGYVGQTATKVKGCSRRPSGASS
jgi:hypothetical protein